VNARRRARRLRIAQIVAIVATVVVAVSFVYVFALPDRIAQFLFVHNLRAGESRADVAALASRLGHRLVDATDGVASVEFTLARTSCAARAKRIVIFFDRSDRVRHWTPLDEYLACS
jgi:hypothetical protein